MSDINCNKRTLGTVSSYFVQCLSKLNKPIFTLDEATEIYGHSRPKTSDFLRDLVNREVLTRLKPGVFLLLQSGAETTQLSNWPLIAHFISGKDYYISHYSAMRLHGMTTHLSYDVTVTVPKRIPKRSIEDLTYKFIYCKDDNFWGSCQHWVTKQDQVAVSDIERTVLDCLARPELCGGVKEVARGLWVKQHQIDWKKIIRYSHDYPTKAAIKRLGCLLEILQIGIEHLSTLNKIVSQRKDYVPLDPKEPKKGKHISKWKILININVEELKASIWE